jgi:hypothetical protein
MTPRGDIVVVGMGARIATGLDALTTAMSIRARKSFVRESRFVDRAGEPIALSFVSSIADEVVGRERFVSLAAPAMSEAVTGWARARFTSRGHAIPPIPMLLATPAEVDDEILGWLRTGYALASGPTSTRPPGARPDSEPEDDTRAREHREVARGALLMAGRDVAV